MSLPKIFALAAGTTLIIGAALSGDLGVGVGTLAAGTLGFLGGGILGGSSALLLTNLHRRNVRRGSGYIGLIMLSALAAGCVGFAGGSIAGYNSLKSQEPEIEKTANCQTIESEPTKLCP